MTDATEPVVTPRANAYDATVLDVATKVSNSWHLEQFRFRCGLLNLDHALQNEFDNQLLGESKHLL